MRDELVTARRTAISEVLSAFDSAEGGDITMSHGQLTALLQTLNALRVTLASALGIVDDDSAADADDQSDASPEQHLYVWSGWMLEWVVGALCGNTPS